jgi:hypothetical protein
MFPRRVAPRTLRAFRDLSRMSKYSRVVGYLECQLLAKPASTFLRQQSFLSNVFMNAPNYLSRTPK